jgi:outer membrane protein OmpA-like peptidoglycan-associated protein
LSKVQNAINIFPGSEITVEGHTDSFGGDEVNLRLSQERAEAVRQYLLANMRNLSADQVKAVGYGESKPIANNETAEGRAKNRRIDIVITPKLDTQVE